MLINNSTVFLQESEALFTWVTLQIPYSWPYSEERSWKSPAGNRWFWARLKYDMNRYEWFLVRKTWSNCRANNCHLVQGVNCPVDHGEQEAEAKAQEGEKGGCSRRFQVRFLFCWFHFLTTKKVYACVQYTRDKFTRYIILREGNWTDIGPSRLMWSRMKSWSWFPIRSWMRS